MPYKNAEDRNKRVRAKRSEWKENGLCTICGKEPLISGTCYGEICKEKMTNRQKIKYHGNPILSKEKSRKDAKKRADTCLIRKICFVCGKVSNGNGKRCVSCAKKLSEASKRLNQSRITAGLCFRCGKNEFVSSKSKLCKTCYLRHMANLYLGNRDHGNFLEELLRQQNGICPYTGFLLILGANASLDHIVPKALGGQNCLSNFQWVYSGEDFCVNMMKRNYKHDEFLKAVVLIAKHLSEGGDLGL